MIDVRLQDEQGEVLGSVVDTEGFLSKRASSADLRMMRYIDPYGDTMFNHLQADDLLLDLAQLQAMATSVASQRFLDELVLLVERSRDGYYLYFYGD